MPKVLLEDGAGEVVGTSGGSTFFVSGGRQLVRSRVTPVSPRSGSQQSEVSGVVGAAKGWSGVLDETARSAWEAASFAGLNGYWLWNAVCSIWEWIWNLFPPPGPPAGDQPVIFFEDVVFDPCVPSLVVTIGVQSGPGDLACWVAVSGASSPGRIPDGSACRTVGTAVVPGVPVDLTAAYVERFGAFPAEECVVVLQARGISAADGAFSEVAEAVVVSVCGGGCSASVVPDPLVDLLQTGAPGVFLMTCEDAGPEFVWAAEILTAGFYFSTSPPTAGNGSSSMADVMCSLGAGDFTVDFLFTSNEGHSRVVSVGFHNEIP